MEFKNFDIKILNLFIEKIFDTIFIKDENWSMNKYQLFDHICFHFHPWLLEIGLDVDFNKKHYNSNNLGHLFDLSSFNLQQFKKNGGFSLKVRKK